MKRRNRAMSPSQWIFGALTGTALFTACFAGGYGLATLLFRLTSTPPAIWSHVIAGYLGLSLTALVARVWALVHQRLRPGGGRWDDVRKHFLDDAIEGMNRIAQGDFSVLLPVEEHDPFAGIAESVNRMARELGTMENLRQDFISNVSHEIQSPLTSISGFAALLRRDDLTPEQRSHYLDVIETESRRLSRLSDNLLKLTALESDAQPLAATPFALDRQIQNAALLLEPQWTAKNLTLDLSLARLTLPGDEALLSQVWIDLLGNAVKFTPGGGSITVTLVEEGGNAVCRVADTGIGIAEEDRMHVFERFFKADRARDRALGGNGLGLAIVRAIVERHGGTVSVESQPGQGSTFTVTLPLPR